MVRVSVAVKVQKELTFSMWVSDAGDVVEIISVRING